MTSHSLFPQITLPTRLSHTNDTLIDNIFCKFQCSTANATSRILLNKLSDHLPCFILLDISLVNPPNPKWIKINTQNKKAILNIISDTSASNLYNKLDKSLTTDPNLSYIIHEVIEKAKNNHMLSKLVKFDKYKHKKSKWITMDLLKSITF